MSFSSPQAEAAETCGISNEPIPVEKIIGDCQDVRAGGMVTFAGMVRNKSHGKEATHLWYEAYIEMAEIQMTEILKTARERWNLVSVACVHRVGKLVLGEIAVLVVTSSVHRKEAYEANQYIIDRVKFELPIWKKEFYADGTSEWRHNCH